MRRTVHLLENKSNSPGSYVVDGVQKPLYPGESVTLYKLPLSVTANLRRSVYIEDVPGGEVKDNTEQSNKTVKENK